jgi:hypothetical protein
LLRVFISITELEYRHTVQPHLLSRDYYCRKTAVLFCKPFSPVLVLDSIPTLCGLHNSSCRWTREALVWDLGLTQRWLRRSLSSGVCAYCLLEVYRYFRGNYCVHRQSRWDFCVHGSTAHKSGSDPHCNGVSHFPPRVEWQLLVKWQSENYCYCALSMPFPRCHNVHFSVIFTCKIRFNYVNCFVYSSYALSVSCACSTKIRKGNEMDLGLLVWSVLK